MIVGADKLPTVGVRYPTGFMLVRIAEVIDGGFVDALEELGLRARHLRVLRHVSELPGRPQHDLAAGLGVDPGNLIEILDELEEMGLLGRRRDPDDRRRRLVELTKDGTALFQRALESTAAVDEDVLAALGSAERRALHRALEKVYDDRCARSPLRREAEGSAP